MGSFADYCEKKVLDYIFSKATFTVADPHYCALSTTTILDDGSGYTEPVGNNYSRSNTGTNNATTWPAATGSGAGGSSKKNGIAITFAQASGSWGTITDFMLIDTASGAGNVYVFGALTASKLIGNGDTASFAINDLTITLD